MDEPSESYPPGPARLSRTPSWVMLGFVLGALFVWALPRVEKSVLAPAAGPAATVQLARPKLTDIEAVFEAWGRDAVWDNDVTEVALWDVDKRSYSICYEVVRNGENLYFRSIPHLTRPVLTHGLHGQAPLLFTETEAMRKEWLRQTLLPPREAMPPTGKNGP